MVKRWLQRLRERAGWYARIIKDARLTSVLALIAMATLVGGMLLWAIEGPDTFSSPFDAIWWAIVTMTAVGYGDFAPSGVPGRLVAIVVMLTGVAVVGVFIARVSSALVAAKLREEQGLSDIHYHNHLIVAGWFPGAEKVIDALLEMAASDLRIVLLNDMKPAEASGLVERYRTLEPKFVRGEMVQEQTWERAAIKDAWAVILMPETHGSQNGGHADQQTLLATLTVRKLNRKVKIYAYALDGEIVPHLHNAGADRVVLRDSVSPYLLASHAVRPGVPEVISEILQPGSGYGFDKLEIPKHHVGKPIRELEAWLREKHSALLVALIGRETVLEMSDILSDDLASIDAFIKRKFEEAGRSTSDLGRNRVRVLPGREEKVSAADMAIVLRAPRRAEQRGGGQ
jgi:voltage-gated potassium channel